jgi:hypothetical protein
LTPAEDRPVPTPIPLHVTFERIVVVPVLILVVVAWGWVAMADADAGDWCGMIESGAFALLGLRFWAGMRQAHRLIDRLREWPEDEFSGDTQ